MLGLGLKAKIFGLGFEARVLGLPPKALALFCLAFGLVPCGLINHQRPEYTFGATRLDCNRGTGQPKQGCPSYIKYDNLAFRGQFTGYHFHMPGNDSCFCRCLILLKG